MSKGTVKPDEHTRALAAGAPFDRNTELVAAAIKGVVSAVPFVGGALSEIGNLFLNPLERRKQIWMTHVGEALNEIQQRFGRLAADLEQDDRFISMLYRATESALKTHQEQKLIALKAALVSSLDVSSAPEDLQMQFFRYIDELTPSHVSLLALLSGGLEGHGQYKSLEQAYAATSERLEAHLDRAVFRAFLQDLDSRFLLRIGDAEDFAEYASDAQYVTLESSKVRPLEITSLGRSFLAFVAR